MKTTTEYSNMPSSQSQRLIPLRKKINTSAKSAKSLSNILLKDIQEVDQCIYMICSGRPFCPWTIKTILSTTEEKIQIHVNRCNLFFLQYINIKKTCMKFHQFSMNVQKSCTATHNPKLFVQVAEFVKFLAYKVIYFHAMNNLYVNKTLELEQSYNTLKIIWNNM